MDTTSTFPASTDAFHSSGRGLRGLRVLLVADAPARTDALVQELRAAGAQVGLTDERARGLEAVASLDPTAVLIDRSRVGTGALEPALRDHPRLRWAPIVDFRWNEVFASGARPHLTPIVERVWPHGANERSLRERADLRRRFEVDLDTIGPARVLRALSGVSEQILRIEVAGEGGRAVVELCGELIVGAWWNFDCERTPLRGFDALAAFLTLQKGQLVGQRRSFARALTVMDSVESALVAAQSLLPQVREKLETPVVSEEGNPERKRAHPEKHRVDVSELEFADEEAATRDVGEPVLPREALRGPPADALRFAIESVSGESAPSALAGATAAALIRERSEDALPVRPSEEDASSAAASFTEGKAEGVAPAARKAERDRARQPKSENISASSSSEAEVALPERRAATPVENEGGLAEDDSVSFVASDEAALSGWRPPPVPSEAATLAVDAPLGDSSDSVPSRSTPLSSMPPAVTTAAPERPSPRAAPLLGAAALIALGVLAYRQLVQPDHIVRPVGAPPAVTEPAAEPETPTSEPSSHAAPSELAATQEGSASAGDPDPALSSESQRSSADSAEVEAQGHLGADSAEVAPHGDLSADALLEQAAEAQGSAQLVLLEAAADREPNNPHVAVALAEHHLEVTQNLEQAERWARRAVVFRRRRAPYRVLLARILEERGDSVGAREELRAALERDPSDEDARRLLGDEAGAATRVP